MQKIIRVHAALLPEQLEPVHHGEVSHHPKVMMLIIGVHLRLLCVIRLQLIVVIDSRLVRRLRGSPPPVSMRMYTLPIFFSALGEYLA